MRSSAVMFRGTKSVIKAYNSNDVPAWSLWNGPKQLVFSYNGTDIEEGAKMLGEALALLQEGGSTAAFMLCVYDDWKAGDKIKSNTPYDNSFNFSIWDDDEGEATSRFRSNKDNEKRLTAIEDLLKKMCEESEEEDKPEKIGGIQGMIAGLLEQPQVKEAIMGKIAQIINKIPSMGEGKKIAGIPGEDVQPDAQQQEQENAAFQKSWTNYPLDQQIKISRALTILMAADSKLGDHLLALGTIARDNPGKYKMALTFL